MTDEDDPFGDLDASLGDDVDPVNADTEPDTSPELSPDAETSTTDRDTTDAGTEAKTETSSEPAFAFDDVKQRPLYARPANWDAFEDALQFDVRRILRDRGHRDIPKRELHDAALRVLAEQPHAIADAVEAAREQD